MNNGHQFEGFGLVHLEAGIAGLPVIGTRECGARDSIEEGKTGLLVSQVRIADELPEAIISLLSDPLKRQQMGEAGRMKALHQTWEKVAEQMAALYEGK
jgi:glycosyltransferase involved in cell wall biosynthesis